MPFSEEIVKTAFAVLHECEIVKEKDHQWGIPETFDNKISGFLTMLHYYELPLVVWNFDNGRYKSDIDLSKAVMKVALAEELIRYKCPQCQGSSGNCTCNRNLPANMSLRLFVENKQARGEAWMARELIETALTVLKKASGAFTQLEYEEPKLTRLKKTPVLLSPSQGALRKIHIGYFFYSRYYPRTFDELDRCDTSFFTKHNELLCNLNLAEYKQEIDELQKDQELLHRGNSLTHFSFMARTMGDGFLSGTGIPHDFGIPTPDSQENTPFAKGELLLGMYFDQTSGLPVLPGEALKGALRSIFEEQPETIVEILSEMNIIAYPRKGEGDGILIHDLLNELFEFPKENKMSGSDTKKMTRDNFLTSFPVRSVNRGGRFLGIDSITPEGLPHQSPKASIPFLKVLPGVVFQFNLVLVDELISKEDKLKLIKRLISEFGLGAKSRRGFGKFEFEEDLLYPLLPSELEDRSRVEENTQQ